MDGCRRTDFGALERFINDADDHRRKARGWPVVIRVPDRGLTPCIPTRARMAALAKPRPATRERPTASIVRLTRPRSCR